jgi:hypothetical protein
MAATRFTLPPEQQEFVRAYIEEALAAGKALERFKRLIMASMSLPDDATGDFTRDGRALMVTVPGDTRRPEPPDPPAPVEQEGPCPGR